MMDKMQQAALHIVEQRQSTKELIEEYCLEIETLETSLQNYRDGLQLLEKHIGSITNDRE